MRSENISNAEFTKEFLLSELRYLQETFWKNEAAGETRVNYFITLVTAVLAGLVALVTSMLGTNHLRRQANYRISCIPLSVGR